MWQRGRVTYCGHGPPGCGASITTRHHLPDSCSNMEETIIHTFFHCHIVRLLCKLHESYMVCLLNGKFLVLIANCVRSNAVQNTTCFSAYSALWESGFGQCNRMDSKKASLFHFQHWWHFINTKLRLKFCLRSKYSLCWSMTKSGWKLHICVVWKVLNFCKRLQAKKDLGSLEGSVFAFILKKRFNLARAWLLIGLILFF